MAYLTDELLTLSAASPSGAVPSCAQHCGESPMDHWSRRQFVQGAGVVERALRPAVLWRKGSFGSDSAAGGRHAERLLTVIATCRQQGRALLGFLVAVGDATLQGGPLPSCKR